MSDKDERSGAMPDQSAAKLQANEPDIQTDAMPDTILTAAEGELDLARLAPQLHGLYQELLKEPIPDRFSKLLDELARKESDNE